MNNDNAKTENTPPICPFQCNYALSNGNRIQNIIQYTKQDIWKKTMLKAS